MNKAAETAKIPCAVCRDLMPLVQDGVASPESEALVQAHMAVCPACRALWQGTDDPAMPELPALDDGKILQKLRRRYSTHLLLLAFVGIAAGPGVYRQRQLGDSPPAARLGRSDLPGYRHGQATAAVYAGAGRAGCYHKADGFFGIILA